MPFWLPMDKALDGIVFTVEHWRLEAFEFFTLSCVSIGQCRVLIERRILSQD
jgi:hypothetical protein